MNEFALVALAQSPFPFFVNRHCELVMCNESEKGESKQQNINQNFGFMFVVGKVFKQESSKFYSKT